MKCVKCKKTIDDGDIFCGYCGINQEKFRKYINKVDDKNEKMIDYGFPIDMIKKISQDDSKLDNYEVRILKEYKELLSQQ